MCQSTRLWVLLPGPRRASWFDVFRAFNWGQLVNNYVPARAGDILKVALIRAVAPDTRVGDESANTPREPAAIARASAASIAGSVLIADKIADIGSLFGLILLLAPGWLGQMTRPSWLSTRLVVLVALALTVASTLLLTRLVSARARHVLLEVVRGSSQLLKIRSFASALLFGAAAWLAESATLMTLVSAVGGRLSPAQALGVLVILNLGIAIPVSVANVGTFEAALTFGLTRLGLAAPIALAVATMHHVIQVVCLGLLALVLSRLVGDEEGRAFRVREIDKCRAIDYYQGLSSDYDGKVATGLLKVFRDRERTAVLRLARFDDPSKKSAIDVGCGGGFYALAAKRAGLIVSAVDIAPGMVNKLRERVDETFVSDLEHFTPGNTYDVVLCAGVLDFVLDPQIAFRNLATLIAPSGRLIVHAPRVGVAGWIYRLEKRMLRIEVNLFSLRWFETEAKKYGLIVVAHANPLPTNRVVSFERLPVSTYESGGKICDETALLPKA